jgi:hypothetical protein
MMDGYPPNELDDEYAALNDPRAVMREVVGLLEQLHRATTRFGDALVAAGLPARAWLGPSGRLEQLPADFPDITLDELITRLAEFAAGIGPHWLHGDAHDLAQFHDEVTILVDVVRPLRVVAQRQRVLAPRDRSEVPLESTLGDARAGAALDRIYNALRDLDALGPFLAPLSPRDWEALAPAPKRRDAPASPAAARSPASPAPPARAAVPAVPQPPALPVMPAPVGASAPPVPPVPPMPVAASTSAPAQQTFRRLRDFAPPAGTAAPAREGRAESLRLLRDQWQAELVRRWGLLRTAGMGLRVNRTLLVGSVALLLGLGTALLTLAHQSATPPPAPVSYLAATPARLSLTCAGTGSATTLTLRDTAKAAITWGIKPPAGVTLSATHGTLKPGASVALQVRITSRSALSGVLTFVSNGGTAMVPYSITCH